ncbi:MAG: sigma factor-like helix-turn-helix DNA-binding protein [Leptospirales bacterium]
MTRRHREPHPQDLYVVLFGEDSTSPEEKTGRLLDSLGSLPERNGRMLKLRYGIKTGISWTLAEIGREYGLSRERVRQILSSSVEKLNERALAVTGLSSKVDNP